MKDKSQSKIELLVERILASFEENFPTLEVLYDDADVTVQIRIPAHLPNFVVEETSSIQEKLKSCPQITYVYVKDGDYDIELIGNLSGRLLNYSFVKAVVVSNETNEFLRSLLQNDERWTPFENKALESLGSTSVTGHYYITA